MSEYRIVCLTSDKYIEAVRPFLWLMQKYWKPHPQVIIGGFTPPEFDLPSWAEFTSIGCFADYPVHRWTDAVIKLFNDYIGDEAFVLMLEDYWLTRPADTTAVKILYDYAIQFKYVLKIDLCADRLYAHGADLHYGNVSYLDLVKSMPGSPYHMSLMTGVWRRDNLLRVLQPGWTPWNVELIGTPVVSHMQDLLVLGTRQWPVKHTLAFRKDDPGIKLDELKAEDVAEMTELGLLKPWGVG